MRIVINGHGGHLCEAYSDNYHEVGETVEDAIGNLVLLHPQEFGVDVQITDCSTTAYERSCFYPLLDDFSKRLHEIVAQGLVPTVKCLTCHYKHCCLEGDVSEVKKIYDRTCDKCGGLNVFVGTRSLPIHEGVEIYRPLNSPGHPVTSRTTTITSTTLI